MSVKFLIQGTIAERVKRKEYEWKVIEFLREFFFIITKKKYCLNL